MGDGLDDLVPPLLDLITGVVDKSAYFEAEEDRTRTLRAIDGLSNRLLIPIGDLLKTSNADLTTLLSTVLDLLERTAPRADIMRGATVAHRMSWPQRDGQPLCSIRKRFAVLSRSGLEDLVLRLCDLHSAT